MKVAIIAGSTRPGRKSLDVANWVNDIASQRTESTFEIVDLKEHPLPLLNEPLPPIMGAEYSEPHSRAWSQVISQFDAFIFVTPEYNHSLPAVLKNAIDYLFHEWTNKAVGFVTYGSSGGVLAGEHLRQVAGELMMADVRSQVALTLSDDFENWQIFSPRDHHQGKLNAMLDELLRWATALAPLRAL